MHYLYKCLNSKHHETDLVISRICHTTCSLTLSLMGSSSRFTVEAMICGYHEYKKGESKKLLKDCEEQLQLSCEQETRLFYYSMGT